MPRSAKETDFPVDVEGVGTFVFGRREMSDEIKIHVEYARLTEAVNPTPWLDQIATWLSTLKVLMVRAPEKFDLDHLDPFDDKVYANLMKVFTSLTAKEASFRGGPTETGKADGAGQGTVD